MMRLRRVRGTVGWLGPMVLAGLPSCGSCPLFVADVEATKELCRSLITLEQTGGEKAPASCYELLYSKATAATLLRGGRAIPVMFRTVGADAVIEGDIVIGRAEDLTPGPARSVTAASDGSPWPQGVMPVQFDSGTITAAHEKTIREALDTWSRETGVQFPPPSQPPGDVVTFRIDKAATGTIVGGGSSRVGRVGGEQFIRLSEGSWDESTVLHEVGHALGLLHEHTRPDRDDYVTYLPNSYDCQGATPTDCAAQRQTDFGVAQAAAAFWATNYDVKSIMQYPSDAFAMAGQKTLLAKTPTGTADIPYNRDLTRGDACAVALLYNPERYRKDCNPRGYPSCMQTGEHLTWSCAGPVAERKCVHVFGLQEKATWGDNFVCSVGQETLTWFPENVPKAAGCVGFDESADPDGWQTAGLCIDPPPAGLEFRSSGPVPGKECVRLFEPEDAAGTWTDNHLCWSCLPKGPRLTVNVHGFAKSATAGTCMPLVDWKVDSNEVISFDVVADDTQVDRLTLSGGFTIHCNTGSATSGGITVSGQASIKQGSFILFDSQAGPGSARVTGTGKIEMPSYVNECGTPSIEISVTAEARGASGTSTTTMSLRYPDR